MLNNKTITLYSVAWGDYIEPTETVLRYCNYIFPYFDEIKLNTDISNLLDFNTFIVEKLHEDIKTDYVLTVQHDGYIINPHLWNNKFLEYDYIGAPWPWHRICGNGGFCLKSKKFLELSSKLKYNRKHHEYPLNPEDNFLCLDNRNYFTDNGCIFADIKTASEFSFEHPYPGLFNSISTSFGFHGKHNFKHTS